MLELFGDEQREFRGPGDQAGLRMARHRIEQIRQARRTEESLAGDAVVEARKIRLRRRESVPELRDLIRKYDPAKLVLISISADDDETAWNQFITDNKMTWPQYRDADKRLVNAFTVRAYPTYLVIDGDGVITDRIIGADPQQSVVKQLVAILKTIPQLESQK